MSGERLSGPAVLRGALAQVHLWGWSYGYESPDFSPDGKTVFAHRYETGCSNPSCLPNLVTPLVPVLAVIGELVAMDNVPEAPPASVAATTFGKRLVRCSSPRPAQTAAKLAALYSGCASDYGSGIVISDPDGANPQYISGPYCDLPVWRADGNAVYCTYKNQLLLADPRNAKDDRAG
jgi:hypothetical protein